MAAAAQAPTQETLLAGRNVRVAVAGEGDSVEVVEVSAGDPWPAEALCRIDLLIRTGHVVRFDADGKPDRRSCKYLRRLGIEPPQKYQVRSFHQRARALAQTIEIDGKRLRVHAGRADGSERELAVAHGRAFAVRRGVPDQAAEALRPRSRGGAGAASRRPISKRKPALKAAATKKRRRRKT